MTGIDLKAYGESLKAAQDEGTVVDIKNADGEPLGLKITIAGPDSDRQKKIRSTIQNGYSRARRTTSLSADERTNDGIRVLAAATIAWEWGEGVTWNGTQPELTAETAAALYKAVPLIRDQLDFVAGERAGFLKS